MSKYFKVGSRKIPTKKLNKIIDHLQKINLNAMAMGGSQGAGGTIIPDLTEDLFQEGRIRVVWARYLPPIFLENGKFWSSPWDGLVNVGLKVRGISCPSYFFIPDSQANSFRMVQAPVPNVRVINWTENPIVNSFVFVIQAKDDVFFVVHPNHQARAYFEWGSGGTDQNYTAFHGQWKLVRGQCFSQSLVGSVDDENHISNSGTDLGVIGSDLLSIPAHQDAYIRFSGRYKFTYGFEGSLHGNYWTKQDTDGTLITVPGETVVPSSHKHVYRTGGVVQCKVGLCTGLYGPVAGVLGDIDFEDSFELPAHGNYPGIGGIPIMGQKTAVYRQINKITRWFRVAVGFKCTYLSSFNDYQSSSENQTPRIIPRKAWVAVERSGHSPYDSDPDANDAHGINDYPTGPLGPFVKFGDATPISLNMFGKGW